ncbi:MAG: hypothetical protein IRY95_03140 [Clostridia bacterium]|nr:hypothetical protein [Clostridia bacterium]
MAFGWRRRWPWWGAAATALVAAGVAALYAGGLPVRRPAPTPVGKPPAGPVAGPMEPVLQEGAEVVRQILYTACGQKVTEREPVPPSLVGLSRREVMRRLTSGNVVDFAPDRVTIATREEGPCPDTVLYRTLTVLDGYVVVYAGRAPDLGPLVARTRVRVDRLLPRDRERLEKGIVVQGDAEVWRLLEGLEGE